MSLRSALYAGKVSHRRLKPVRHALSYRVYWILLDLDELAQLGRAFRFFSVGRFNLFAFDPKDHGAPEGGPLRAQIKAAVDRAGIAWDGSTVRLLCMPRVLGYGFNPLSVYFCHNRADDRPCAILYEVHNTFGERHGYLMPVDSRTGPIRQHTDKSFYVSPFMDMALNYRFRFNRPDELLRLTIEVSDSRGLLLTARYNARRAPLTDAALLRLFFTTPALPARVLGGIHWEALKLWRKGIGLRRRPPPPQNPITLVPAPDMSKAR